MNYRETQNTAKMREKATIEPVESMWKKLNSINDNEQTETYV